MLPQVNLNPLTKDMDTNKQFASLRNQISQLRDEVDQALSQIGYDNLTLELRKKIDRLETEITGSNQLSNMVAETIKAKYITADMISANYASIGSLNAVSARVGSLEADHVSVGSFNALSGSVSSLSAIAITTQNLSSQSIRGGQITSGTINANRIDVNALFAKGAVTGTVIVNSLLIQSGEVYGIGSWKKASNVGNNDFVLCTSGGGPSL